MRKLSHTYKRARADSVYVKNSVLIFLSGAAGTELPTMKNKVLRSLIENKNSDTHTHTGQTHTEDKCCRRSCPCYMLLHMPWPVGEWWSSRLANQSLSSPVLQRSSWLHRAECRTQSTIPCPHFQQICRKIHLEMQTDERSDVFKA